MMPPATLAGICARHGITLAHAHGGVIARDETHASPLSLRTIDAVCALLQARYGISVTEYRNGMGDYTAKHAETGLWIGAPSQMSAVVALADRLAGVAS